MEGHPGWGQPAAPTPPLSPIGTLPLRSSAKSAPAASLRCRDPPPQSPPPHAPPSLLSWVKVFQSSWESFCFFSTTSFPPSTSTLSVYFCDLPILVRSPRVTSSFTCDGTPGRCRNTPPRGTLQARGKGVGTHLEGLHRDALGLAGKGLGGGGGGGRAHLLQGFQRLAEPASASAERRAPRPPAPPAPSEPQPPNPSHPRGPLRATRVARFGPGTNRIAP